MKMFSRNDCVSTRIEILQVKRSFSIHHAARMYFPCLMCESFKSPRLTYCRSVLGVLWRQEWKGQEVKGLVARTAQAWNVQGMAAGVR